MADRATTFSGAFMKVTLGTTKVLGISKASMSGVTRKTVDTSEFGVDCDTFEFGSADAGTISFTDVNFDPTDAAQMSFVTAVQGALKLYPGTTSGLRLYLDSTSYYTIGTSGTLLMTSAGNVEFDRAGSAKTKMEGKVSGAFMVLV
jgi:hypothetical protein